MSGPAASPTAVFVYGTLLPGEHRWPLLADHAVEVARASVPGQLFDTGRGYPCALFDRPGSIPGAVVEIAVDVLDEVLRLLDEVEGVALGLYQRVVVTTEDGRPVWSYAWAESLDGLVRIVQW